MRIPQQREFSHTQRVMHGGYAVAKPNTDEVGVMILRPREQVFLQGRLAAIALLLPFFAVLYWLTIPSGGWVGVLVAQVLTMLLIAGVAVLYRRASIEVSPAGVREFGLRGLHRRVPRDEVSSILQVCFYRGLSTDTELQLFVLGRDGSTVLRMRGRYWSATDMRTVIDALGAPATIINEPQTIDEFRQAHSSLLYRHERRISFSRR